MRRLFALALLIAILALAPVAPAATQSRHPYLAIDSYIDSLMTQHGLPAAAVVIVSGDQIVHARGFGTALPDGAPVMPNTPFLIASLTKSFTALAVMQLVEAGAIDLDAPVQRYLPWFRVASAAHAAAITPRHLLAHTSGLSTAVGNQRLVPGDPRDATIERYARALATISLTATPGQRYQYSNANYVVLGALVEAVSGLSFEAYLQRAVFGPLDMIDSFAFTPGVTTRPIANGVRIIDGIPTPLTPGLAPYWQPAGTIAASADDLGRYLVMLLNGGRFRHARLLSADGVAALWSPTASVSPSTSYGLGWSIAQQHGTTVIWHNGLLHGRRSYMAVLPDVQLAVALLLTVNESSPPPPTDTVSRELRARLLAVPR